MIDQRQQAFLEEMGVGPLWQRRDVAHQADAIAEVDPMVEAKLLVETKPVVEAKPVIEAVPVVSAREFVPDMPPEPIWDDAVFAPPVQFQKIANEPDDATASVAVTVNSAVASMNWTQLKAAVAGCEQCGLCKKRTNTVFGVGDEKAKWLFVGEGPGRNEDLQGEPFVGPAGKLLDNMLLSLGLKRGENAYIANIVKCRPTDANGKDRPPTPQEADACMPYLQRQIELIQPNVIVALGKTAAISLLKRDPETPVSSLRGSVHQYAGLPLIVTYHPAYLLRNLPDKRKAWADLCMAMKAFAHAGVQ